MAYPHGAFERLPAELRRAAVFLMWAVDVDLDVAADYVAAHHALASAALAALANHHKLTTDKAVSAFGESLMRTYQAYLFDVSDDVDAANAHMVATHAPHADVVAFVFAAEADLF